MWRHGGWTDRQTARGYYSCLHCEQCGRAVKNLTSKPVFGFVYAYITATIRQRQLILDLTTLGMQG